MAALCKSRGVIPIEDEAGPLAKIGQEVVGPAIQYSVESDDACPLRVLRQPQMDVDGKDYCGTTDLLCICTDL